MRTVRREPRALKLFKKLVDEGEPELRVVYQILRQAEMIEHIPAPGGLVGWWPGDGNANDIEGSHDGSLQGGTAFEAAMVGSGFALDGIDDGVVIPHDVRSSKRSTTVFRARIVLR